MTKASGLAVAFLTLTAFGFCQEAAQQGSPRLPAGVLGPQLIAWSQLLKPSPVLQTVSPSQLASPQQPGHPDSQPQAPTQSFAGMIVRIGSKYLLKISESTAYQLDDLEKVQLFEGKEVKIVGRLDINTNILHIISMESLS